MKILFVSSFLPYPLFSGGHVRLFNILKELSKRHEITLVCEKRDHQTEKDIQEVKKLCKEIFVVARKKQWSVDTIFKTAISANPFLLTGHYLPQMKKILAKLLSERKFDLIHVETFYVFQNVPKTYVPVVIAEHNIEYEVYQRFTNNAPLFARPFLQIDVEKIKYWEKKTWQQAAYIIGVSQYDLEKIRAVNKHAGLVANGVDPKNFKFQISNFKFQKKYKTILFIGDFKWVQNRDAASWIVERIWPEIEERVKGKGLRVKLWIVGKNIQESIKRYASSTVIFDEQAPSKTSDIYKKADILLAPIRVGGGTSYKILEAMASGIPVVTTKYGIQGFSDIMPEKDVLIGENEKELASCVLHLLENKTTYNNIAKNATKIIEKNYTWKTIVGELEKIYEEVIR